MTNDETAKVTGPLAELALITVTGQGKVIWPDGTEVSAEQFQNSVAAAVTGFTKGRATGRREAAQEARRIVSAVTVLGRSSMAEGGKIAVQECTERLDRLIALFEAEEPHGGEVPVQWQATRWWRAVAPDGTLWLESSNEREVRERARPDDTIQRLYETVPQPEWRDA